MGSSRLNITWVVRSLLDYRVPVIRELDALSGGGVRLLYSQMYTPPRVQAKLRAVLGERAVAMSGEKRIGPRVLQGFSNSRIRVVYQPRIFSHIRQSRPDVMIGEGFFQWTSFALGWRILRGVPLVVSYERTFHTERNAQWFRRGYRRMVMRFVDAMCCNGRLCVEYSRSLGMDGRRITTPNMVADTETLARQVRAVTEDQKRRMRQSWNAQGTVVLYVGRLVALKGLNYLLEAWSRLERQGNRQATLVIVGGGSEETALREQAARLGLRNVRLAGAVDYDNVASCYAAADALVIPTLDDNWSLVVPEAMACGLPVLCSKYNGCWPELVHQGRNGWVFDPLDPEDLAGCLSKCIDAGDALRQMGAESEAIVADFTPLHAAEALYRACEMAMARRDRAPAARIAGTPRVELPARRDGVEVQSRPARPRITWIVRSLLDYRVPVIQEVDELSGGGVHLLYGEPYTPPRVQAKLRSALGERAVPLTGEKCLGPRVITGTANASFRIVYQPGVFKHIERTRPDVLIGDGFFQWTSFALAQRILKRVPVVVCYERTFHTERNVQWYREAYRRMVMSLVGAMCCNGKQCVEYSLSLGMAPSGITVPNMAADTGGLRRQLAAVTDDQRKALRGKWNVQGCVFLYVGQMIVRKGLHRLLDAWQIVEQSGAKASLVLIGKGSEEGALRRGRRGWACGTCVSSARSTMTGWASATRRRMRL